MPRSTGTYTFATTLGASVRAFVSRPSASVQLLVDFGILAECTGQKTNRVYSDQACVELLLR